MSDWNEPFKPLDYEWAVQYYYGNDIWGITRCDSEQEARDHIEAMKSGLNVTGVKTISLVKRPSNWEVVRVDTVE